MVAQGYDGGGCTGRRLSYERGRCMMEFEGGHSWMRGLYAKMWVEDGRLLLEKHFDFLRIA